MSVRGSGDFVFVFQIEHPPTPDEVSVVDWLIISLLAVSLVITGIAFVIATFCIRCMRRHDVATIRKNVDKIFDAMATDERSLRSAIRDTRSGLGKKS